MAKKDFDERRMLGAMLLWISAFTGVMALVYAIKFMFFSDDKYFSDTMMAAALVTTMLFGAFLALGMNYTIRVPRGVEGDRNQMIFWIVMILLGTVICVAMQIIIPIGKNYGIIPVVYYTQSWMLLLIGIYSMKFYRKKKI